VGALAVALGFGAAIFHDPGIALAADDDAASSVAADSVAMNPPAADTSAGAGQAAPPKPKHRNPKVTFGSRAPAQTTPDTGAEGVNSSGMRDAEDVDRATPAERPSGASGGRHRRNERPSASREKSKPVVTVTADMQPSKGQSSAANSSDDKSAPAPVAATISVTVTDPSPPPRRRPRTDTKYALPQDIPDTNGTKSEGTDAVTKVVIGLLSAVGVHSEKTDTPAAPTHSSFLTGAWALIGREIEYTLFNRRPNLTYDASQTAQTDDGQITGSVRGTDADDDILTYTVAKAPQNGSVAVRADGAFTYTPYAGLAATGGTDTFTLKASDAPGNPFHIHGFALFDGSATAEVTVAVTSTTAVSPLGTADQIAAEQLATQIANSPIVMLAKVVLKLAWQAAAQKNFALVGGPDAENLAQLDRAVDEYALQAALELQLLNPNDPHVLQQVMPPHTWFGESFRGARILYDNPDTIYRMIPVNTSSSYVITGRFDGPMPADTTFSVLTGLTGTTTSVLLAKDLVFNDDGSFTITADASPADGRSNHLQLPAEATLITARNTLSDWNTQVPMSLSVARVGGPPNNLFSQLGLYDIPAIGSLFSSVPVISQLASLVPPLKSPPLVLQAAETAIVMALGLFMEPQYMAVATTDADTGQLKAPNTLSDPAHNASFLATQLQSAGYFQLADNEALVITIDPGNAGYFVVPVTNDWTITDNYWDQQTSLNKAQALENNDGTYTIVVSPTDPGVANWVSTGGLNQGTLSIRFQDLAPDSDTTPTVSAEVVSLDDLASVLPPKTVYVTPEQRVARIAMRKAGYGNRYAPYPQG